jgi:hypothetical protein
VPPVASGHASSVWLGWDCDHSGVAWRGLAAAFISFHSIGTRVRGAENAKHVILGNQAQISPAASPLITRRKQQGFFRNRFSLMLIIRNCRSEMMRTERKKSPAKPPVKSNGLIATLRNYSYRNRSIRRCGKCVTKGFSLPKHRVSPEGLASRP